MFIGILSKKRSGDIGNPLIPLSSIISEYKYDDNALDTVGSNNGTATNITYVSGLINNCGDYNGSTSSIDLGSPSDLNFGDGVSDVPFSLSLNVKFDRKANHWLIQSRSDFSLENEYELIYEGNTNKFVMTLYSQGGTASILKLDSTTFISVDDTWYNVILTYDGNGVMKFYIDGVDKTGTTTEVGTYVAMNASTNEILLGKAFWATNLGIEGFMDSVRFWDIELTDVNALAIATDELAGTDINP